VNASRESRTINLALQGGGSHGAYTWGVLDTLLADGRLDFEGVTGASAGAMNAVVLADGWLDGMTSGRDPRLAARDALSAFWGAVGTRPSLFNLYPNMAWAAPRALAMNPMFLWFDIVSRLFSPYQLNPFNYNPLRNVLAEQIDFGRLRAHAPFKLFIAATNVRKGRVRIFREHELDLDMLLASACLPFAFQAVPVAEEGGVEHYWDGGYMGNPALWPLFYATRTPDLLLIQINPLQRDALPDTAQEIIERAAELSFNASLVHEMRAIDFVQRLLAEHKLDSEKYRKIHLHMIGGDDKLAAYGASSKYNTERSFIDELKALGQAQAEEWLATRFDYVGHAGTVRIAEAFLS
jgi:NTE family protein